MIILNKMFAEKVLSYMENMNRFLELLYKLPNVGEKLRIQVVENNNRKLKNVFGVIAQLGVIIAEFLRKLVYVLIFMYIPYRLIAHFCPLIAVHQQNTIIYMFFILSTLCGSFANTTIMAMGDRDYLMMRVMLISPYMNFLGKLAYKIVSDFVYFTIILTMFGVSFWHALCLSLLTAACRPVGEMIAIMIYESFAAIYENRGMFNGLIMAVCVLIAYGIPVLTRDVSEGWLKVAGLLPVIIMLFIGAAATAFLWWYKNYRKIVREAMHLKRV
jgi:hypothetical protein